MSEGCVKGLLSLSFSRSTLSSLKQQKQLYPICLYRKLIWKYLFYIYIYVPTVAEIHYNDLFIIKSYRFSLLGILIAIIKEL
jgi:hypothetical protein